VARAQALMMLYAVAGPGASATVPKLGRAAAHLAPACPGLTMSAWTGRCSSATRS
jgi:hypothetical protein